MAQSFRDIIKIEHVCIYVHMNECMCVYIYVSVYVYTVILKTKQHFYFVIIILINVFLRCNGTQYILESDSISSLNTSCFN